MNTALNIQETIERITSDEPTDFRIVKPSGGSLYVYCALDTVLYTTLTGERVEVETRIAGKDVRFTLTPDTNLMVSFIDPKSSDGLPDSKDTPSNLCPYLKFFENSAQYHDWKKTLPPSVQAVVTLISVKDAFTLIKRFVKEETGATE
ncbi:hypothetical protein B9Q06_09390 [Candidatus Marsarchaeota G2 archaeon ECH_B_2]|uniref:Uncharacterized protein n=3 Tax=Candidatus Marsarchaeota group 2 TaxID=2203771 RepID=A0A2R6B6T3_9ARCH|nr:MAG: hypothetical protein B9Q06_09390 [Candidatus Marsarchaeota G2 archaeon ECH_B_2]PSN98490.1 MAG: hypothetical protein B9Q07_09500 [Candidatus Marsarchaeota G2 archaeon ECH_B_3]PSO01525.1 MAG: hypothetical protein B9Q05_08780 [Candidatus Marsarchaeota G2 archaeon ECH_B_1]